VFGICPSFKDHFLSPPCQPNPSFRSQYFSSLYVHHCAWRQTRNGEVHFTIQKKWEWRYWPRLLREKKGEGELWDNIGVDWRRWKSEDEEKFKSGRA
jgi:hypothetical protein